MSLSKSMLKLNELLRRFYQDLVVGRSRVRISAAIEQELEISPIFIFGVYRSGTTLLRYILDSHSKICCPPESNFIDLLETIVTIERSKEGLAAMGFEEGHVVNRLRKFCIYFFNSYAKSNDKQRWADKSTSYVDHMDFIARLFPNAKFITLHRNPLDQAHSFSRGGTSYEEPFKPFCQNNEDLRIGATRYWAEQTKKIVNFEKKHPEQTFRLIYEELCHSPKSNLEKLFNFIEEPWEPDVLEFYRFQHDKGPEHGRVIVTNGFAANTGYYYDWPEALLAKCKEIIEPLATDLRFFFS